MPDVSNRKSINLPNHILWCIALFSIIAAKLFNWIDPAYAPALDLSQYTLTFDENFDAIDVSAWGPGTRWIARTPWAVARQSKPCRSDNQRHIHWWNISEAGSWLSSPKPPSAVA